jgi:hypothetical protein
MRSFASIGVAAAVMLTAATPSLAAAPKGGKKSVATSPLPSKAASDLKVVVTPHRAVEANLEAAATIYRAAALEEMQLFAVADRIAAQFHDGLLPVGKAGASKIHAYVDDAESFDEAARHRLYAHVFGGEDETGVTVNRDFDPLLARFLAAAAKFEDQAKVGTKRRGAQTKQVRRRARELALNLSNRTYGAPLRAAPQLAHKIELAEAILADAKVRKAYKAKSSAELLQIVAGKDLGLTVDVENLQTRAEAGAEVIGWLGKLSVPPATTGGAAEEATDPAETRVPGSARDLNRTIPAKHKPAAVGSEHAKVFALCFDAKGELVDCTVETSQ